MRTRVSLLLMPFLSSNEFWAGCDIKIIGTLHLIICRKPYGELLKALRSCLEDQSWLLQSNSCRQGKSHSQRSLETQPLFWPGSPTQAWLKVKELNFCIWDLQICVQTFCLVWQLSILSSRSLAPAIQLCSPPPISLCSQPWCILLLIFFKVKEIKYIKIDTKK